MTERGGVVSGRIGSFWTKWDEPGKPDCGESDIWVKWRPLEGFYFTGYVGQLAAGFSRSNLVGVHILQVARLGPRNGRRWRVDTGDRRRRRVSRSTGEEGG